MGRTQHRPDQEQTASARLPRGPSDAFQENSPRKPLFVESPALMLLLVLALAYTMYFGAFILMPMAFAFVLGIVFLPIVRFMRTRMYIPQWLGSLIVLIGIVAVPALGIYGLAYPTAGWFTEGFEGLDLAEQRVREYAEPLRQMQLASERVAEIASAPGDAQTVVRVDDGGYAATLVGWTQEFFITAAIILVLLYFIMATDGLFSRKLVASLPSWQDKHTAVQIADQIQVDVSRYLLTITVINALLGVAVGLAMWLLGMPSPILWGVLAALLNYIPYVGALIGPALAAIVSFVTFDSVPWALLVGGVYYALTGIEGNFIIPTVLGKRLLLNPVVLFVGLIYWGWVWGIPGALLAVPMLSIIKIIADKVEPLNPVGDVLGT